MMRTAMSETVQAKARALAVRYEGRGRFTVASGTDVGRTYTIKAPAITNAANPVDWSCECAWAANEGRMCSHVRRAARWAERNLL